MSNSTKSRLQLILVNLTVLIVLLLLLELVLMVRGHEPCIPGRSRSFHLVDELQELSGYELDEDCLMRISNQTAEYVRERIASGDRRTDLGEKVRLFLSDRHVTPHIIAQDFRLLRSRKGTGEFSEFHESLNAHPDTGFRDAVFAYTASPINSDGYRSIAFRPDYKQKKVLLLGDSFLWGHAAKRKYNSFSDLLLARGIAVFNTGIVGTDLVQYSGVARKFVSRLQADFVVVNVYMGNDVVDFRRDPSTCIPVFFPTNAGNLMSNPHGLQFQRAQEAFDATILVAGLPLDRLPVIFCWIAKCRIGTELVQMMGKAGLLQIPVPEAKLSYDAACEAKRIGFDWIQEELTELKTLCAENDAELLISIIPDKNQLPTDSDWLEQIFGDLPWYYPSSIGPEHFSNDDIHFNEEGHRMYADHLQGLIDP